MKLSFITKYFIPREKKFFSLFNLAAENIVEGSEQLKKLFISDSINDTKSVTIIINSIAQKGDENTEKILNELNSTYISSLDYEFVDKLTYALDDILHLICGLSEKANLYSLTSISIYMKEMVSLINKSCIQLQMAVEGLENINDTPTVLKSCKEIDKNKIQIDEIRRNAIKSLFESEKDPIDMIKQKEILQSIEMIANKIEDVSHIIKTTLVKYA